MGLREANDVNQSSMLCCGGGQGVTGTPKEEDWSSVRYCTGPCQALWPHLEGKRFVHRRSALSRVLLLFRLVLEEAAEGGVVLAEQFES